MADNSFTSGEKRGLIIVIALIAIVIIWTLVSRTCAFQGDAVDRPSPSDTNAPKATVKIISNSDSSNTRIKKKRKNNNNRRPDGKQRDYLSEPAYDN